MLSSCFRNSLSDLFMSLQEKYCKVGSFRFGQLPELLSFFDKVGLSFFGKQVFKETRLSVVCSSESEREWLRSSGESTFSSSLHNKSDIASASLREGCTGTVWFIQSSTVDKESTDQSTIVERLLLSGKEFHTSVGCFSFPETEALVVTWQALGMSSEVDWGAKVVVRSFELSTLARSAARTSSCENERDGSGASNPRLSAMQVFASAPAAGEDSSIDT